MAKNYLLSLFFLIAVFKAGAQSWQWAKEANSPNDELVWDLACDTISGEIYAGGYFDGNISSTYGSSFNSTNGQSDGFVAKYNSNGTVLWAFKVGGSGDDEVRGVAVDPSGNIYISGHFSGTVDFNSSAATFNLTANGTSDGFLAKYTSAGTFIWAVRYGGSNMDEGWKMHCDQSGNIFITGSYLGSMTFYSTNATTTSTFASQALTNMFTCKYNSAGVVQWAVSGGGSKEDIGYKVIADNSNVYMIGTFCNSFNLYSTTGSVVANLNANAGNKTDVFIAAYSQAGAFLWATSAGSSEDDLGMSIAQDATNLYITGSIKGTTSFPYPSPLYTKTCLGATDIFIASLSKSTGTYQWVSSETGSGTDEEEAYAIRLNRDGNLIVAGSFKNTLNYSAFGVSNISSSGGKDIFLSCFDVSGNIIWAEDAGAGNDDMAYTLTNDNSNTIFVAGEHADAAVFGSHTLTNGGGKNIFVAKYGCSVISNNTISSPQTICSGNAPSSLSGTVPVGGAPYMYMWKQSTDNTTWTNAAGTNNVSTYSPPPLTVSMYYTRTVSSSGACANAITSPSILITVDSLPTTSLAGNDQTICSSSSIFAGNSPTIGNGTWTLLSGSGNFSNPSLYNSGVNFLGTGTNQFIWTISNGSCPVSRDTVVIIRSAAPTTANAGSNQTICSSSASINANNPFTGTGSWQVSAGGASIANLLSDTTTVTGLSTGMNAFVWSITNGVCPVSKDTVYITVDAPPTTSAAGVDQTLCSSSGSLGANLPSVGSGAWSAITGAGVVSNTSLNTSAVNSLSTGTNQFIWTISNGSCPVSRDTVTIFKDAAPTTANAGSNQTICSSSAFINANNPFTGTGSWQVSAGGASIANLLSYTTAVTGLSTGMNAFVWLISNGVCPVSQDTVYIVVDAQPTTSNAGSDQLICSTSSMLLANSASSGTGSWSVLSGAGTVTTPGLNNSAVNSLSAGINSFIWTISNGVCPPSADTVQVTVSAQPSTANAGSDQNLCAIGSYTLNATTPLSGTGTWSVLTGSATLSSVLQTNAVLSGINAGSNVLMWTVSNGVCPPSADTVVIYMDELPTVSNAGNDSTLCNPGSCTMQANAPVSGTGQWTLVSGSAAITNPLIHNTTVSGLGAGTSVFVWTISNGVCPSSVDTVLMHIDAAPDQAIAGIDQFICNNSATLSAVPISNGTGTWSIINSTGAIANAGSPGTSLSNLSAGNNLFLWAVSNGICPSSNDTINVHVDGLPSAAIAGTNQVLCSDTIFLSGNTPQTGTGTWSLLNATCNFSNVGLANSFVTNFPGGQNNFVWLVSNGVCTPSSDTVLIQIDAQPDLASAGNDMTICSAFAALSANTPIVGTGAWTILSGSSAIATPGLANSIVNNLDVGENVLRWKISNGICADKYDDIVITRYALPDTAIAGSDFSSDIPAVQLNANLPLTGAGIWSIVSGEGIFEDAANPATKITELGKDKNVFRWTIQNGVCPASIDEITVILNPLKIPNGFSPNDDAVNDQFVIPALEYYNNIRMSVFNRWGNIVYESSDYKNNWDGKNNNNQLLCDDTYYYLLEVKPGNSYNGFVIIKTQK